jgi:hypothetical protein
MKLNDFSWYEYPGTTAEPPRPKKPRTMEGMQSDLDAMSVAMFVMIMIMIYVLGTSK